MRSVKCEFPPREINRYIARKVLLWRKKPLWYECKVCTCSSSLSCCSKTHVVIAGGRCYSLRWCDTNSWKYTSYHESVLHSLPEQQAFLPDFFTFFFSFSEYQCITSLAFMSRTGYRMSPQQPEPVVVDVGSFAVYECDAGKYLSDYSATLDVLCRSDFTFNYDDTKTCSELCDANPPGPAGVTFTWPPTVTLIVDEDGDSDFLGWWESTPVE